MNTAGYVITISTHTFEDVVIWNRGILKNQFASRTVNCEVPARNNIFLLFGSRCSMLVKATVIKGIYIWTMGCCLSLEN